jgi:hypothetical protein
MNVTPIVLPSVVDSSANKLAASYWDKVLDTYDAGNYKEAILNLLNYVDPELISRTGNADASEFTIPHGSALIKLTIGSDTFSVSAPFLILPEKNSIPLLRQVSGINFSPLVLADISLEKDQLTFNYSCPLSLCEPYKIYNVLREICMYADIYDDEFITKFKAVRLREPVVKNFSKEKLDEMWGLLQKFLTDSFQYIKYFTDKRWDGSVWDIITHTLFKIEFTMGPQGQFRNELEKNISIMLGHGNLNDLNASGQKYLASLQNYKREDFDKDMYMADTFIPYKTSMDTYENLQSFFQGDYERAQGEINTKNYIAATFSLYYAIFRCFYYHNISEAFSPILKKGLIDSSNKPWEEGAKILMSSLTKIMSVKQEATV